MEVATNCVKAARKLNQQTRRMITSKTQDSFMSNEPCLANVSTPKRLDPSAMTDHMPHFQPGNALDAKARLSPPVSASKTPFGKAFDRGINWALGDDGDDESAGFANSSFTGQVSTATSNFRLYQALPSDDVWTCLRLIFIWVLHVYTCEMQV